MTGSRTFVRRIAGIFERTELDRHLRLAFLLVLGLCCVLFGTSAAQDVCGAAERQSLLKLNSQIEDPEDALVAWMSVGVPVRHRMHASGRVIGASLTASYDNPDIFREGYQVKRGIRNPTASFGDLTELTLLFMSRVAFRFAYPDSCSVPVRRAVLEECEFKGMIPAFIGNFARLSKLSMNKNQWTGGIPELYTATLYEIINGSI